MSKPSTPVRRSKVGRPGSAGGEIPLTASMEVLPPDPCPPGILAARECDPSRSQDPYAKPRTPVHTGHVLSRTRSSSDGRRSAGPHEVISLASTVTKPSSAHHSSQHVSSSISGAMLMGPPSHAPAPHSGAVRASTGPGGLDMRASTSSSVTQGDVESMAGPVRIGGSAAAVAKQVAAAAGHGGSARRYAVNAASAAFPASQSYDGNGALLQDASERSIPGTPASVASGRHAGGGTFFTDLRRSFGAEGPPGAGVADSQELGGFGASVADREGADVDGEGDVGRVSRMGLMSAVSSRLNPMQSPSGSERGEEDDADDAAYAEYAGQEDSSANDAGGGLPLTLLGNTSMAMTDYGNPLMTPTESRAPTPPPQLDTTASVAASSAEDRQSLLLLIRNIYATEPIPPPSAEPSRPVTAQTEGEPPQEQPSQPGRRPEEEEGDGEDGDEAVDATDDSALLAASRAAVAALSAAVDDQQERRRSELGEYMTALQDLKDESGVRLVELPADWGVMLERLFRQRRTEYTTLQGWLGPRRFEDLPISTLPSAHPDPAVEEGLARIRELDSVLNDKLIAALISHRETFPEQWAEQERRRLDRHTKGVEDALKKERQKRLHAARIARAVTSLNVDSFAGGEASSASQLSGGPGAASTYSRLFVLKPEEEALVERVLRRNDEDDLVAANPFDLDSAATYSRARAGDGACADPADIELELDLMLPSAAASRVATPSAAGPQAMLRLSSMGGRRGTDADGASAGGGSGGDLSLSASASSLSLSRPGTSGEATGSGGASGNAAAALHRHPMLLAIPRDAVDSGPGGGSGLLPERVYDDPRVAARALRAINARLAAFEAEHLWDESGVLMDFKGVSDAAPVPVPLTPGAGSVAGSAARPASPPRSTRLGPAPSLSGVSTTAAGQRDYLREQRTAKELAAWEHDVDSALRSLKTSEVVRLGEGALKALIQQCRQLQELNDQRRIAEQEEAAARRAQQKQILQLQQQPSASGRGDGSSRAPAAGSKPTGAQRATGGASSGTAGAVGRSPAKASSQPSAESGPAPSNSGRPVSGGGPGSAAPSTQRHGSAGSNHGKAPPGPSPAPGSGSRRASDPASTPASASGAGAAAQAAGAQPQRTGGGSGAAAGGSSSSGTAAARGASSTSLPGAQAGPSGTPPKPRSAVKRPPASPAPPSPATNLEGGLPPPPPPPPP